MTRPGIDPTTCDSVRVQFGKIWKPTKVVRVHSGRSYSVQTRDGGVYCRNRRLLNKNMENLSDVTPFTAHVLADPKQQYPFQIVFPREPHFSNTIPESGAKTLRSDAPYITRSGREVKPNKLYVNDKVTLMVRELN